MDLLIEAIRLAAALVALATAIVTFLSTANGSDGRKGKKKGR